MSRLALLSLSLMFARCTPPAARDAGCVDDWLAARGLDAYGNPTGTTYSGGTPLVDEATGEVRTREEYLLAHHPELAEACPMPSST